MMALDLVLDMLEDGAPAPLNELDFSIKEQRACADLFTVHKRKAWDTSAEARCDFEYRLRLTRRADTDFITIWQKSVKGRKLTDIKKDPEMVDKFALALAPVIKAVLGSHLRGGGYALVTSPKRRHLTRNFATLIADRLALALSIPFIEDVATCRTKQRMNAVFDLNRLPEQPNLIVIDDFVTTGNTLASMRRLLEPLGKNLTFFAGINNKL